MFWMMEKLRFVTRFKNLNHSTGLQDSKHPIRIWWDSGMNFQPIFFDHGFYLQTNLRLFLSADPLSLPLKSIIIPCLVGMHLHCVSLWIKCNNLTVSPPKLARHFRLVNWTWSRHLMKNHHRNVLWESQCHKPPLGWFQPLMVRNWGWFISPKYGIKGFDASSL